MEKVIVEKTEKNEFLLIINNFSGAKTFYFKDLQDINNFLNETQIKLNRVK